MAGDVPVRLVIIDADVVGLGSVGDRNRGVVDIREGVVLVDGGEMVGAYQDALERSALCPRPYRKVGQRKQHCGPALGIALNPISLLKALKDGCSRPAPCGNPNRPPNVRVAVDILLASNPKATGVTRLYASYGRDRVCIEVESR